jgi:membrane fusion protein, heavy metal efflux system
MYVEGRFFLENNPAKGLPETAIITEEEQNFVLIKKEKTANGYTFEKKAVKVGAEKNGFVEILNSDDFEGQEILVNGGFNLIGVE